MIGRTCARAQIQKAAHVRTTPAPSLSSPALARSCSSLLARPRARTHVAFALLALLLLAALLALRSLRLACHLGFELRVAVASRTTSFPRSLSLTRGQEQTRADISAVVSSCDTTRCRALRILVLERPSTSLTLTLTPCTKSSQLGMSTRPAVSCRTSRRGRSRPSSACCLRYRIILSPTSASCRNVSSGDSRPRRWRSSAWPPSSSR